MLVSRAALTVLLGLLLVSAVIAADRGAGGGAWGPGAAQEADDEYDPDEFEGYKVPEPHVETTAPSDGGQHIPPSQTGADTIARPKIWKDYAWEMGGIAVIILYLITYLIGKRRNMQLATMWYRAAMPEFQKNFAWLGRGETSEPHMWKESQSLFQFYASGRLHCDSCSVQLELCGRQDLMSVLYNLIQPAKDLLVMEFAMPDDTIDNVMLSVVSRRDEKAIRSERPEMEKLGKRVTVSGLSEGLCCWADTTAAIDSILLPFVDRLSHHAAFVRAIHISDRIGGTASNPKKGIRVELFLDPRVGGGEDARVAGIKALTKLAMALVDKSSTLHLSTKDREKTKALRAAMLAEDFKSSAKAREEDQQRRKKEALDKMTPEEQARMAEKNAKKEAKKASKMFRVVKMKG